MKKYIKPPFLTTSFTESGKSAKKRFANILNTGARRLGAWLIAAALTGAVAVGAMVVFDGGAPAEAEERTAAKEPSAADTDMGAALGRALLEDEDKYAETELWTEGHLILKAEATEFSADRSVKYQVYALTKVGGYSFINGKFVEDSGTGAIPVTAIMTGRDGEYTVDDVIYPSDGSYYEPSIKAMFPEELWERAMNADEFYDELVAQSRAQAEEYLRSIGRQAEVVSYSDLDVRFPDIGAEASNAVLYMKKDPELNRYPDYIGTVEYLEGGERFVYETQWQPLTHTLSYIKYRWEDGEIVASRSYTVNGGKVIKN